MNELSVKDLDKNNQMHWDEFNNKSKEGSFFHTLKWNNLLENSFSYKKHFFMIYHYDKVICICPFYERTIKGFKGLIPIPESDYRHILIEGEKYNDLIAKIIFNKAIDISKKNKLSFILFSTLSKELKDCFNNYNPFSFPEAGTMVLNLKENNPKKIWEDIFTTRGDGVPRKYIKRFDRDGIKIKEVDSIDDLKLFYKYYAENLKFINVKPYPCSYFENCWNSFSASERRITLLHKNHEIFGGLFAFIYLPKKTMYLNYLALNRQISNKYHPPYYLYWDAIIKATEMDLEYVSFGATPNDINNVTYRIKMKFGSEYKKEYRMIFPVSKLFKLSYTAYSYFKKREKYI